MGRQKNECIYSSHSTHLLHNTSPRTPHPNYKDGAAPRLISNLRLTAPVLWRRQWQLQYSCLENPTAEEPGGLQSMGSLRVGHD